MAAWYQRLHNRIVIPLVLVAVVAASGAALLALRLVTQTFEARVSAQLLNTADVLSRGGFAENLAILRSVKAITGAEVVTFTDEGAILASSVEPEHKETVALVMSPSLIGADEGGGAPAIRRASCWTPCFVAYQRLSGRADARVAVIGETAEVFAATRALARSLGLIAAAGLLAMIVTSQMVARRVTAPIEALVAFTDTVASGGSTPGRANTGDDEIGRLGQSFNQMIDRVEQARAVAVRSEKLAIAGLLAARVAHDIRNPLAAIKMQVQLIESRLPAADTGREMVASILHDIRTVESVILDLIEVSRPGELKRRPADLNQVVGEVLKQFQPQMDWRKIVIDMQLSPSLPSLLLDTGRFKRAVSNVLANAAEAMPSGGRVMVTTRLDAGKSTVILEVCDDGVGIDPAVRDRIFDPFVTSKPDGVGLGLVNARAVVEQHDGRIEILPRAPQGTIARIALPIGQG